DAVAPLDEAEVQLPDLRLCELLDHADLPRFDAIPLCEPVERSNQRLAIVQLPQHLLRLSQLPDDVMVSEHAGGEGDLGRVAKLLDGDAGAMNPVRKVDAGRVRDRVAGHAGALVDELP